VDRSGDVFGLGSVTVLLVDLADHGLELLERKPIRQRVEHGGGDPVVYIELTQFGVEDVLLVDRSSVARGACLPTRRFHFDLAARVDDARAKLDRRDVPLADGPQAQDEALLARGEALLVGRRHDGRIGQRGGLDRVLLREIGADEEPALRRELARLGDMCRCDGYEVRLEYRPQVDVARGEPRLRRAQRRRHL
jgi:hypothetical protein